MSGPVYPLKNRSLDHLGLIGRLLAERIDTARETAEEAARKHTDAVFSIGAADDFNGGLQSLLEPTVGGIDRKPSRHWRRLIVLALIFIGSAAHAAEADREGRRFVISSSAFGVIMLDTMTGETWKFGWSIVNAPVCKDKAPVPSECQQWGWSPMPYFAGTPGKPR